MRTLLLFVVFGCGKDASETPGTTPSIGSGTPSTCVEQTWYVDTDGDGFGDVATEPACEAPTGAVAQGGDCDDSRPEVYPGAAEVCDGTDGNCDGAIDSPEPATVPIWYRDTDGDGHGDPDLAQQLCTPPYEAVAAGDDCDDSDPTVSPSATETCDGRDEDCNGIVDDGVPVSTWYPDVDLDGFGDSAAPIETCAQPPGTSATGGDCNDFDGTIYPGALEQCDGNDTDCNGLIDDNATDASPWWLDSDGDGQGDPSSSQPACAAPAYHVGNSTDCDDSDPATYLGAPETCDGLDNDCDTVVDEDAIDAVTRWLDSDGDGFGDPASQADICNPAAPWVAASGDCDDADSAVYPGAPEYCSGIDEDCNGILDDPTAVDASSWNIDADGDGFGDPGNSTIDCPGPGLVADDTDCDDTDPTVNPGQTEVCDPLDVDEDCNTLADDLDPGVDPSGWQTWYLDADSDGVGSTAVDACDPPPGGVSTGGDCDDTDATVFPGAIEICDAIDHDCTGDPWDAPTGQNWYPDGDGDGWGDDLGVVVSCQPPPSHVSQGGDCDDSDPAIHPGADELCWDLVDQDCDGLLTAAADPDCGPDGVGSQGDGAFTFQRGGIDPTTDFGSAVLIADVNGNGFDDIAIGDPAHDVVYVWYGPRTVGGLAANADTVITGSTGHGSALALVDADDDGVPDLAIGAPGASSDQGRVAVFSAASLTGANLDETDAVQIIDGLAPGHLFGSSLAGGGDADGDGVDDLLVGAPGALWGAKGAVYVLSGGALTNTPDDAFARLDGEGHGDTAGSDLDWAGDVDGDGLDDILVGACTHRDTLASEGKAYLVYSPIQPGVTDLYFAAVHFPGGPGEQLGCSVAAVGDLDLDGYADVVLGAPGYAPDGGVAVFHGPVPPGRHDLGAADAVFDAEAPGDNLGRVVAPAGDIDSDGHVDLLIGAPGYDAAAPDDGRIYVLYGPVDPTGSVLSAADAWFDGSGSEGYPLVLSGGGDLDGDGYDDFAVGMPDEAAYDTGIVRIFLGGSRNQPNAFVPVLDPTVDDDGDGYTEDGGDCDDTRATVNPGEIETCEDGLDNDCEGTDAWCAPSTWGDVRFDYDARLSFGGAGIDVDVAGDLNGDGHADVIVGGSSMPGYAATGFACVYYGPISRGPWEQPHPDACWLGENTGDEAGTTVRGIGDFSGDGIDDIAIGARSYGPTATDEGKVYIVFGGPSYEGLLDIATADLTITERFPNYYDRVGLELESGDFDGDGLSDLVIAAEGLDVPWLEAGGVYVFDGGRAPGAWFLDEADTVIEGDLTGGKIGVQLAVLDINGDTLSDLIVGANDFATSIVPWANSAAWLFHGPLEPVEDLEDAEATWVGLNDTQIISAGDLNGDGYEDAMFNTEQGGFYGDTRAVVWFGPVTRAIHTAWSADVVFEDLVWPHWASPRAHAAGDVDGDGYSDLLICGFPNTIEDGCFLMFGPYTSGSVVDLATAPAVFDYIEDSGAFGVAVGDVNGDGYGDVITGSPGDGAATVHFGGLRTTAVPVHVPPLVLGTDDRDGDGWTVAGGDCNDTDALVHPGQVEVCEDELDNDCVGGDRSCAPLGYRYLPTEWDSRFWQNSRDIGDAIGAGDLDGDGHPEIVIGTNWVSDGGLYRFQTPRQHGDFSLDDQYTVFGGPSFGADLTLGDADGDGLDDILAVASNEASLLTGGIDGVITTTVTGFDRMGEIELVDLDGSGLAQLVLGDTGDATAAADAGAVYLFPDALGASATKADASAAYLGEASVDLAGEGLATLDVDGDGLLDVVVGAWGHDPAAVTSAGRAYLLYGPHSGTASLATAPVILDGTLAGETVGENVDVIGDVDGDGLDDFSVGAAGNDVAASNSGSVFVFTSAPAAGTAGIASVADIEFQGTAGERIEAGRHLGDMDSDGNDDFGVGGSTIVNLFYGPISTGVVSVSTSDAQLDQGGLNFGAAGDVNADGYGDAYMARDNDVWLVFGGER